MDCRLKAVLGIALALVLSRPGLAQEANSDKCMGGPPGSKCGGAAAGANDKEHDLRVKLDKYDAIAIKKKIVSEEKFDTLDAKKKEMIKKLAFYDSARKELKKRLAELGEEKKEHIEYKKAEGALKMVDKEFDKSLAECAKEDKAEFACPAKD